jgi:putative addiction module component (TIGR02574 family)
MDTPASTNASNGFLLDTQGERVIVPVMPLTPEQLAEQAMDLPTESRARLADLLVESLDAAEFGPIDRAWAAEARRRLEEVRSGTIKPIPADEVFRKVRDSLKR